MKKFEYIVVRLSLSYNGSEIEDELDKLGRENWELVSVVKENVTLIYFFKREIKESSCFLPTLRKFD